MSCINTEAYPITELYYYDSSAGGQKAGRLSKIVRYPQISATGCSGYTLTTQYLDYNAEGMPLQVTDEAGNTTTYAYNPTGTRKETIEPNGVLTTYTYDALDRLTGELR